MNSPAPPDDGGMPAAEEAPTPGATQAGTPQAPRWANRDQPPWPTPRRSGPRPAPQAESGSQTQAEPASDPGAAPSDVETEEEEKAAAEVEVDLEVAAVARQRDEYLESLRRLQADFENYRKRVERQRVEQVERAAGDLVAKLLPVCDTADLAIAHGGGEEVKQIWTALFDTLERQGLVRIDPVGDPFDPTLHDAVAHEPAEGDSPPAVAEVLRAGYLWKGRVLRPAMVKVRG